VQRRFHSKRTSAACASVKVTGIGLVVSLQGCASARASPLNQVLCPCNSSLGKGRWSASSFQLAYVHRKGSRPRETNVVRKRIRAR
jgi:hypothetical protein